MPEKKRAVLTPSRIMIHGVLVKNPILVQVIGLCPAVAAAADLYAATVLSIVVTALLILCECIASMLLKKAPRSFRVGVYFLLGLVVCTGCAWLLEENAPDLLNRTGVYLPLMAASSAVALRSENFAVKKSVHLSFLDALANGIGTSLVLMISGFVRGLLGSGMIFDYKVFATPPLRGLAMPFGGFIVLGFLAALLKRFISGSLKQYDSEMAFGIRRSKKKKAPTAQEQQIRHIRTTQPAKPVEEPKPEPEAEAEEVPADTPESHAEAFYEKEAVEPEPETEDDDAFFDAVDAAVQEELDAILESIGSFENILNEPEADDHA